MLRTHRWTCLFNFISSSFTQIRVRNLNAELTSFKRPANFRSRASPSPQQRRTSADSRPSRSLSRTSHQPIVTRTSTSSTRNASLTRNASSTRNTSLTRASSQTRSSSHGRTPVGKSSSTVSYRSNSSNHRGRSISGGGGAAAERVANNDGRRSALGLFGAGQIETTSTARRRSASNDGRTTSRERWATTPSARPTGSLTNQSGATARIRYRSPSPTAPRSTARTTLAASSHSSSSLPKRFDPTDYVRQKKEKEKERRNSTEKRYKIGDGGGGGGKGGKAAAAGARSDSRGRGTEATPSYHRRGLMTASPEDRKGKGRTSSGESVASVSRSSSVESINSQRSLGKSKQYKNPLRQSNDASGLRSAPNAKSVRNSGGGCAKWSPEKENRNIAVLDHSAVSVDADATNATNDVSLGVDPDNEMARQTEQSR